MWNHVVRVGNFSLCSHHNLEVGDTCCYAGNWIYACPILKRDNYRRIPVMGLSSLCSGSHSVEYRSILFWMDHYISGYMPGYTWTRHAYLYYGEVYTWCIEVEIHSNIPLSHNNDHKWHNTKKNSVKVLERLTKKESKPANCWYYFINHTWHVL